MSLGINIVAAARRPYPLAAVEMLAMSKIRSLAQRSLSSMSLTAAIDPTIMITDAMADEFVELGWWLWTYMDDMALGLGLAVSPLVFARDIIAEAITTSKNTFIDAMKVLINRAAAGTPTYGEYFFAPDYVPGTGLRPPKGYEVQYGDIRSVLGSLGGGSTDSAAPLSTGISGGAIFHEVLAANNLDTPDKLWLYGDLPRRAFNGHMQVDGLVFREWEDAALEIAPQDYWLRVSRYRPGDHWGCACIVVPYVPNFGEPFTLTVDATTASAGFLTVDEFACHDASCAPPPVGTGGSVGGFAQSAAEKVNRLWGAGIDALFSSGSLTTTVPFPSAPRNKHTPLYDRALVERELAKPPVLEKVDPRILYGNQPGIVQTHVRYYMSKEYYKTGRTAADEGIKGNAFPVIYVTKAGRHIILVGHHRATASLLQGEMLDARVIREP